MRREKGKAPGVWGHILEVEPRIESEQNFVPCGEGTSNGEIMIGHDPFWFLAFKHTLP